jgi:hypothetical protein
MIATLPKRKHRRECRAEAALALPAGPERVAALRAAKIDNSSVGGQRMAKPFYGMDGNLLVADLPHDHDVAALELARQLGVKCDSAWLIKQKLMEVMRQRNATYKLAGDIQVDDAYLGGEKPGKVGRGAANKVPFVVAVARLLDVFPFGL